MSIDAPVKTVVEYYKAKFTPPAKAEIKMAAAGGRSVDFSDDTAARPVAIHTVLVNTKDTSTTLVIPRGPGETRTYIAWKQYRRFAI